MWYLYIIYSDNIDRYYVGVTENLKLRLERHNLGWGRYTKRGIPWVIVYSENYLIKTDAFKREREIKKYKSRMYIEKLFNK